MRAPSNGPAVVAPGGPAPGRTPSGPPATRTAPRRPIAPHASELPWIGPRGGRRDKLCVRLPEALRDRLDDALLHLGTRPLVLPGGTATLRSLNNLIAFACHALCSDVAIYRQQTHHPVTRPAGEQLAQRAHPVPQDAPNAVARRAPGLGSMYRSSWQDELAAARCQLSLRIPMSLSVRLRETLTWLQAEPEEHLPPDFAGVGALSDLVGLACHRLCSNVERIPNPRRGDGA